MASIYDWSTTAASNANSDSGINFAEGQAPSTVNNSSRQLMGRVAELVSDIGGTQTFGGTADALTLTAKSAFTAYADGQIVAAKAAADNTGAATLNVNGIAAKAIRKMLSTGDSALAAGDILEDGIFAFRYNSSLNSSAGAWQILNPVIDITSLQPLDATLTALAGVTVAADEVIYATGADAFAVTSLTAAGRALIDDAAASNQRTTLGLGSAAVAALIDEDDMSSDDATAAASQQSIKAYNDTYNHGRPSAVLEDQKSSGTDGGASLAASWQTRDMNSKAYDPNSLITLSSDEFTPSVGGWMEFAAPVRNVGLHKTRLYNVTDATVTKYGTSMETGSTLAAMTVSEGGSAVVAGKTYRLEHYTQGAIASIGLGSAVSQGTEIYSRIKFWRHG